LIGWATRQQAEVIEYLKAENLALRQKLGGKRLPSRMRSAAASRARQSHSEEDVCVSSPINLGFTVGRNTVKRVLAEREFIAERRFRGRLIPPPTSLSLQGSW
jgi:hypothetical protein